MNLYILAALFIVVLVALVIFHLETKRFIVKTYTITSKKLPKAFHGTKIALVSDLHNVEYGKENQKLLEAIDKEKPEYILVAGDMLVAKAGEDFSAAIAFLKAISEKYPVYYSYGNHECRLKEKKVVYKDMAARYNQEVERLPLFLLHNQNAEIKKGASSIRIYGLEIGMEYYYKFKPYKMTGMYLNKRLGKKNPEEFSILIAHNPYFFPAYAEWGADLVVSGHNHGGIAQVPFLGGLVDPNLRIFPKYDKGLFQEKDSQMVLSAGTGSHKPNFRAFNLPELSIIKLEMPNG